MENDQISYFTKRPACSVFACWNKALDDIIHVIFLYKRDDDDNRCLYTV